MDKETLTAIRKQTAAGNWQDSLRQLDDILTADANNATAWCERGTILLLYVPDRQQECMAAFDRSLRLHAENPMALYNRGCLHTTLGNVDAAVADVGAAIDLDQDCLAMARTDDAFDAIRDNAAFSALLEA